MMALPAVRRLTPLECERLQGLPDFWTSHDAEGKQLSDAARYGLVGNSVAVPCVEWIARRLVEVDAGSDPNMAPRQAGRQAGRHRDGSGLRPGSDHLGGQLQQSEGGRSDAAPGRERAAAHREGRIVPPLTAAMGSGGAGHNGKDEFVVEVL